MVLQKYDWPGRRAPDVGPQTSGPRRRAPDVGPQTLGPDVDDNANVVERVVSERMITKTSDCELVLLVTW